jgi:hypothetical protein
MLPIQYLSLKREKKYQFFKKVGKFIFFPNKGNIGMWQKYFYFSQFLRNFAPEKKGGAGSNI